MQGDRDTAKCHKLSAWLPQLRSAVSTAYSWATPSYSWGDACLLRVLIKVKHTLLFILAAAVVKYRDFRADMLVQGLAWTPSAFDDASFNAYNLHLLLWHLICLISNSCRSCFKSLQDGVSQLVDVTIEKTRNKVKLMFTGFKHCLCYVFGALVALEVET